MPPKKHKKSKKGHKSPNKSHKKSPKRSPPQRRTDVVNDNPVSPSLGDANAFNLLLQKHSNTVEREFLQSLRGKVFLGYGMFQLLVILININMGQGGRDDFKLRACRSILGMRTYTVDDKHDSVPGVHAKANFCMSGALIQAIALYFGHGIIFDLIELDYFFSPGFWAGIRWSEDLLFVLCELARIGKLSRNCQVFLPHFKPIAEFLKVKKIRKKVDKFFDVELSIPGVNGGTLHSPLYYASSICEKELKELNPPLYNDNQEKQFINGKFGWFILSNKWEPTEAEIEYERQRIIKQLEGYGPSQMRTRNGSGTGPLTGLPAKPATR